MRDSRWLTVVSIGNIQCLGSTVVLKTLCHSIVSMGDLQDPKMEVLYHMHMLWGYSLIYIYIGLIYGMYLQCRFLKWPLIVG